MDIKPCRISLHYWLIISERCKLNRVKGGWCSAIIVTNTADADFDYESLLDRARANIPDDISNRARWTLPSPEIMIEGQNTILRNFQDIVSHMERDENHLFQYIQNELGTSGSRDGPRARFKGRIPTKRIRKAISSYVSAFIKCHQCGAPDTHFQKEDRTTVMKCQACGASRPVKLKL